MRKIVLSAATAAIVAFATAGWAQTQINRDETSCSMIPADGTFCLSGQFTTPPGVSTSREAARLATFAKELFGAGSTDTEFTLATGTDLRLTANYETADRTIPVGKTMNVTFTLLDGVQFAENVEALAYSEAGSLLQASISQADSTGGERGDSSVTYVIKAEAPLDDPASVFTFTLPKLMNLGALGGPAVSGREPTARVSVTVEPAGNRFDTGNKFAAFPPASSSSNNDNVRSFARSTLRYPLTVTPDEEQSVNINIDDRAAFVVPDDNVETVSGSDFGSTGRSALKIATLEIDVVPANRADNRNAFQASSGDMMNITVTGPLGTGDILFLSRDTTYSTSGDNRDVMFTVTGRTATSSSVTLTSVADGHERTLYLVPAAGRTLSRGLYRTTFEADFSEDSMRDTRAQTEVVRIEYSNLTVQGYAYAIPNPDVSDTGNLRLRCESSGNCAVFLDCYDQNGRSIGGFPELTVTARATMRLNTKSTVAGSSLTDALGVDTWEGRLSCEVLSNANVGVQVLTRSGGTLVNNTYISGSEPSTTP